MWRGNKKNKVAPKPVPLHAHSAYTVSWGHEMTYNHTKTATPKELHHWRGEMQAAGGGPASPWSKKAAGASTKFTQSFAGNFKDMSIAGATSLEERKELIEERRKKEEARLKKDFYQRIKDCQKLKKQIARQAKRKRARRNYQREKAALCIQRTWRMASGKHHVLAMKLEIASARVIQSLYRGRSARCCFVGLRQEAAAGMVQRGFRGHRGRRAARRRRGDRARRRFARGVVDGVRGDALVRLEHRRREEAATKIQECYRRWHLMRLLNDDGRPQTSEHDRNRAEALSRGGHAPRDAHMGGRLALLTGGGGAKFSHDASSSLLAKYSGGVLEGSMPGLV